MPDSTARRERLASPPVLLLLAGLFALAFAALLPRGENTRPGASIEDGLDEVELAYLRARVAAGEPMDIEIGALARGLLEDGRPGQARSLIATFPDVALDGRSAFLLELEGAADALAAAIDGPPRNPEPDRTLIDALAGLLVRLRDEPGLQSAATLARGARLSLRLDRPALRATLHATLAEADLASATRAWAACGASAVAAGARSLAIECYRSALDTLGTGTDGTLIDAERLADDAFDLRLALLGQLVGEEDRVARDATVTALLARDTDDKKRLGALARTLLAVERPGDAARVHGRLAEVEPERRVHWWLEAARWSEAAGRPAIAAAWVERAAQAGEPSGRATLDRRVETLLVAAGREREVLARVAARIQASPGNIGALRDGIRLARRGGDLERASGWNETLLERLPDDSGALARAIDLALADADLDTARIAAERAVHRLPDDTEVRVRLAQIAEWSGDPDGAAAQWRIIAAADPDGATLRELIRLARLTRQPDVAADAAFRLALLAAPSDADVRQMVALFELDGRPDAAAAALEAIAGRHGPSAPTLALLGRLHERHGSLERALDAWRRRASLVDDVEGTLERLALHWRLNERDAAGRLAAGLRGTDLAGVDGDVASLLSAIAWRERMTWLARAVAPAIPSIEDPGRRLLHGRRLVDSLRDDGDVAAAVAEADRLWRETGDTDFAITAMNLAAESGDATLAPVHLVAGAVGANLGSTPEYWTAAAALRLGRNDADAARGDYERALELDPDEPTALISLLWLLMDAGEHEALKTLLDEHARRAADTPELWSVFAMGRLVLGEPETSIVWFERLSDRIGTDYGLLLGYADALESDGRADAAARLRRHAYGKLRPALLETLDVASGERETLLREYVALASRHDGLDERWAGALLGGADDPIERETTARWREDVAITWLLSTERHDHARLVMARLHGERATAPPWQALSIALAAGDLGAVSRILDSDEPLSTADRLLALRAVGDERIAQALAADAMRTDPVPATRDFAAGQYAELRAKRPSWAEGFARRASLGALDVVEAGVAARHTFADSGFGLSLEVLRRSFASDTLDLDDRDEREALRLSLLRGDSRRGLRLDAGIESDAREDRVSGGVSGYLRSRDGRRELSAELALAENATESPEFALGAVRDRVGLYAESGFGNREYVRLQLEATELSTRVDDRRVARGATGSIELGTRGAFGGTAWSAGVRTVHAVHDRNGAPPDGLGLSANAAADSVLAPRDTSVALGGSLAHGGGVGAGFPRTSGPRWSVDASLDHAWPERSFGLRVDTGLGIRVIGGDELSFTLSRDTRAANAPGTSGGDGTELGIGYRFHF